MKLSDRMYNMTFSATRKLNVYTKQAKEQGKKIYHLNIGQPDIKTPEGFFEAIKNFKSDTLAYGDSNGDIRLIESMKHYYETHGIYFDMDEILITNGGSEALLFSLLSTCNSGDSILLPEPFYTDYNALATELNLRIIGITTKPEEGYHLPPKEKILSLIEEDTKAILINNPNNPSGVVYTADEIRMVLDIAIEKDLFIISDEVYREFVYDGIEFNSFTSFHEEDQRVIIVDSISKRYSACGARIGCIASKNKELMYHAQKLAQARVCPPTLEQIGAIELYKTPASYLKDINEEYGKRRNVAFDALNKMKGVVCKKPNGAFYIAAKLPVDNAEKFCIWMLSDFDDKNETVLLSPLEGFYHTEGLGVQEVRIAYVLEPDKLERSMQILHKALTLYPGRTD